MSPLPIGAAVLPPLLTTVLTNPSDTVAVATMDNRFVVVVVGVVVVVVVVVAADLAIDDDDDEKETTVAGSNINNSVEITFVKNTSS